MKKTMRKNKKRCGAVLLFLAAALLWSAMFSSCAKTESGDDNRFPMRPDRIVIGSEGKEMTLTAKDDAYAKIASEVEKRVKKSAESYAFDTYKMSAYEAATNRPLTQLVREGETYVEYRYDTETEQLLSCVQSDGKAADAPVLVREIQFPLTGEYHSMFFVGQGDGEISYLPPWGELQDELSLISYVQQLVQKAK